MKSDGCCLVVRVTTTQSKGPKVNRNNRYDVLEASGTYEGSTDTLIGVLVTISS